MKGSLVDSLKKRFAVLPTDSLGDAIFISGEELDLDWILTFFEEGYRFEGTRIDGHPTLLVQLQPTAADGSRWKGRRKTREVAH